MSAPVMVRRQCAWCGKHLGIALFENAQRGDVTHGMCFACAAKYDGQQPLFEADTAPSSEHSQGAPRDTSAAASTPEAQAVCFDFLPLSDIALICALSGDEILAHFPIIGWSAGNQFIVDGETVSVREAALVELVSEFSVTGYPDAARRLLSWLTRAKETSYPPRRVRKFWWQEETAA